MQSLRKSQLITAATWNWEREGPMTYGFFAKVIGWQCSVKTEASSLQLRGLKNGWRRKEGGWAKTLTNTAACPGRDLSEKQMRIVNTKSEENPTSG